MQNELSFAFFVKLFVARIYYDPKIMHKLDVKIIKLLKEVKMKRNPVVAGSFYPGYANVLRSDIKQYIANAEISLKSSDILGVIAPHAGYTYSGQCAAFSYKALIQKEIEYAVIIAPSHRYANFKYSVGNFESYLTPLGEVPVAEDIVKALMKNEDFCFHQVAHQSEHSLEVQLPFLQVAFPGVKIIPILLGSQSSDNSEILAETLANEFNDKLNKTAFIISSDLSHYYSSSIAEEKDNRLLIMLEELDTESMKHGQLEDKIEACGMGGIFTLIYLAKKLNYRKVDILQYIHSGQISGDMSQVVGYLAAAVYK